MKYQRFYKEGPGELPPFESNEQAQDFGAELQEEWTIESDEQVATRLTPEALEKGYQEKVIAALTRIAHNPNALPVEKEWLAKIQRGNPLDTGDLRMLDEIEMLEIARIQAEGETSNEAARQAKAVHMSGGLLLMNDDEIEASIERERRASGEMVPDEIIEMVTPEYLRDDPEFTETPHPEAMRLMNEHERLQSMKKEEQMAKNNKSGIEYIELTAPEGDDMDNEHQPTLSEAQMGTQEQRRRRLSTTAAERDEIIRKLGPSSKPKTVRTSPPPEKQGLLTRLKGWFSS